MTMPEGDGGSGCGEGGSTSGDTGLGGEERVEIARAIAPSNHAPGLQILHRKAERIKFDIKKIIGSEATNRIQDSQ
jgi:hypothetical protein